jgi:hypothetical protein
MTQAEHFARLVALHEGMVELALSGDGRCRPSSMSWV